MDEGARFLSQLNPARATRADRARVLDMMAAAVREDDAHPSRPDYISADAGPKVGRGSVATAGSLRDARRGRAALDYSVGNAGLSVQTALRALTLIGRFVMLDRPSGATLDKAPAIAIAILWVRDAVICSTAPHRRADQQESARTMRALLTAAG